MALFVLIHQGFLDPSAQEEHALLSGLKDARVIDRMPGSILVEGEREEVARVVQAYPGWSFSPAQAVGIGDPKNVDPPAA